jgi:SAM-dependent methyltransferase
MEISRDDEIGPATVAGDGWLTDLQREYAASQKPLQWPIPEALRAALAVTLRDRFAIQLSQEAPEDIALRYAYLTSRQMGALVRIAERNFMPHPLRGTGIELGAGCGVLAAVVARRPEVESVLAVEVCEQIAELLIPRIARHVLGDAADKVLPITGSFDDLKIPDESLDFAIEHDSLHHSDDLTVTMTECARVLKPGGLLVCFDRCHDDSVSDAEVERLLSKVYGRDFLVAHRYPPDITLTRGENGEHEYRLFEWRAAADAAGLASLGKHDVVRREPVKKAVKGLLSLLPRVARERLYKTDNADLSNTIAWVRQLAAPAMSPANGRQTLAPKTTNILVFQKPS